MSPLYFWLYIFRLIMTFVDVCLKRHNFVTSNDVIKHILPYISATEPLINYCIF